MILCKKTGENIHGSTNLSADLFYALKLITTNGSSEGTEFSLALGEHEDMIFSEVRSSEVISMAILDKKKHVLKGFRMNPTTRHADKEVFSDENLEDRIAVSAIVINEVNPSGYSNFFNFENTHSGDLSEEDGYELEKILESIASSLVKAIYSGTNEKKVSAVLKPLQQINISLVETGLLTPSKIILGHFEGFQTNSKKSKSVKISDIKDKFVLNKDRVLTPEEKELMFNIPSYYSVSSNVLSIAEKIKASWNKDPNLRKVNVLMEGPMGTGKTLDSKVLSRLLGIPYTKITCFSDMDSSHVTGMILPEADECPEIPVPSEDEIFFDPQGCYERITGKPADENITEADVHRAIKEMYENFYNSPEGQSTPRYTYYASEIVKAFENGWLCEIQEPTCIADAAVLLILNSALEKDGVINLSQRTVKRHPECIFVMTTNRDYEGCRPLNQALRDRFNITKKVTLPSTEEQMERLSSATGCTDNEFLRIVVESCNQLNKFLADEGIAASISLRGMQDFVVDIMEGFDLRESIFEGLIYKISTGDDEVMEMENFLNLSTRLFSASLEV